VVAEAHKSEGSGRHSKGLNTHERKVVICH
jgi:hypothetical protein